MKFEEHEGQLFRMLEEPVPLTPDAEMPCLVRLIQDDSRMGMFNRDTKPNRLSDFYLAARIVNNNIIVDEFMESDYHRFEIIGYPVDDGSKEWALYQMMQGEKVFRVEWECCDMYCQYTNNEIITFRYGISSTINPVEEWIANAKRAGFGWQIYKEPKSQYKVGDWVETNKQHHVEITEFPAKHYNIESKVYECYNLSSNKRHLIEEREIVRKLSPSEVVIDFGSGIKGWICYHSYKINEKVSKYYIDVFSTTNQWLATLAISALDTHTRELVESLLKAMREEEK